MRYQKKKQDVEVFNSSKKRHVVRQYFSQRQLNKTFRRQEAERKKETQKNHLKEKKYAEKAEKYFLLKVCLNQKKEKQQQWKKAVVGFIVMFAFCRMMHVW